MSTNFDLKEIWSSQPVGYPDIAEVYAKAKQVKQKLRRKAVMMVCLTAVCFLVLIIMCIIPEWNDASEPWIIYEIGFGFVLSAAIIFGFNSFRFVMLIKKMNIANPLQQTMEIKKKLCANKKVSALALILDCIGINLLLLWLPFSQIPIFWRIALCALVDGFFTFMWFYVSKKKHLKQQTELNSIIEQLEYLKKTDDNS